MDTARLPIGTLLAERYEIVEIVGRGGMGTVYRALDRRLQTHVAVKEMRERRGTDGASTGPLAQFEQEARLLAALRHPNLPAVTDYFVDEDRWYLVMEFIEGSTVESRMRERESPVPAADAVAWGIAIADTLDYLHRQNPPIVFRDIKPANIMLRSDGTIKLIDFGIARRWHEGASSDTLLYGSPGYSPPEQYGHTQTEPRSDIYALGATLHHLITGRDPSAKPFRFPRVCELVPSVPDALDDLIARCLELDPTERPACAADVRDALVLLRPTLQHVEPPTPPCAERHAETTAASRREPERPPETVLAEKRPATRTPARPTKRALAGAAICVLAVLAVGSLVALHNRKPAAQPTPVRPQTQATPAVPPTVTSPPATPQTDRPTNPMVRVISDIPGESVFLDDQNVGTTPWQSDMVAPGTHFLRIVPPPGSRTTVPWQREIELRRGESLGVGPQDPGAGGGSAADAEPAAELPSPFALTYQNGLVIEGIVQLHHATGRKTRVAAFFYDRDQTDPLSPRDPDSANRNTQDQLCVASDIRADGSPAEVPVRLFVPASDLPLAPRSAWCRIVVFVDDRPLCRSELYPVPIAEQ